MNLLSASNLPSLQLKRRPERLALEELHSTFIRNVEHELRTPLTMMLGYAELLCDGDLGKLSPEQKRAALVIADRACQMRTLVERIGVLLSSESYNGVSIPVALAEVIVKVVEKRRAQAEKKGLTLQMQLNPDLPSVAGDPYQLQEMFDCLIENAIKFTPPDGRVEVRGYAESGWGCLAISDTGIGIEPDKLSYLGVGFYQVDSSTTRQYGGLGLGLTLARSVVEAHSGQIEVESQPGQGSRFTVKLPLFSSGNSKRPGGISAPHILLVDDEENMALTMQAGLKMLLECKVTTATSGEQALQLFEASPFDLLITDYRMPDMDGLTLAARVRQVSPCVGIIMITAYGDDHVRERAAQIPVQAILDKPVNLTDVRMITLQVLNGKSGK
jgi:CheY-like chemotaxis protein